MNYLKYIELAAENLQFYLWLRSYTKRFDSLPASEKALAPEWVPEHESDTPARSKGVSADAAAIFQGTDFASDARVDRPNPFNTPPHTPNGDAQREAGESLDSYPASMTTGGGRTDHILRANGAFEGAGLKWKPCELNQRLLFLLFQTAHSR